MGRLRIFFTGRLHDEIAELRQEIAYLRELVERQRLQDVTADDRVRDVMAQALTTLALDRER